MALARLRFMRREPSHEHAEARRWRQEIAQTNLSYDQKLPDSFCTTTAAQGKTGYMIFLRP
jgi:hypothetical protein